VVEEFFNPYQGQDNDPNLRRNNTRTAGPMIEVVDAEKAEPSAKVTEDN
jgi:hypothetical protein